MAEYPAVAQSMRTRLAEVNTAKIVRTESGKNSVRKDDLERHFNITVAHPLQSDWQTIETFYQDNKYEEFLFQYVADGSWYACIFIQPPEYIELAPGVWELVTNFYSTKTAAPATDFIYIFRTGDPESIGVFQADGTNNFSIDWGDGSVETITTPNPSHTYLTPGDYTVTVSGTFTSLNNQFIESTAQMIEIVSWGNPGVVSLNKGFLYSNYLVTVAGGIPSSVTDMTQAFDGSGLSDASYDAILAASGNLADNITAHFGTAKYTRVAERDALIARGWIITDGGPA